MLGAVAVIAAAYLVGSIPVAYIAGRVAGGVDIRDVGSGNVGASNVWRSVSKSLVVPVGLAQIAQGAAAVLIARAGDQGPGMQVGAAIAAMAANDWNPWLRFAGGRGVGQTVGVLLVLAPWALAALIIVAIAGVALRAIPQFVVVGLATTPIVAAITGAPGAVVGGCAALTGIAMLKRVLANGAPPPDASRDVWLRRLAYDRDILDRDAWVMRNTHDDRAEPASR